MQKKNCVCQVICALGFQRIEKEHVMAKDVKKEEKKTRTVTCPTCGFERVVEIKPDVILEREYCKKCGNQI